ncbi:MAG: Gfo/Idh/MocA family oxidoreductase [Armatimonadetes bacterium]|nr:Gfo/Idh/MocA family oxidoreductase [Armatimonadota bacterium]MDE2207881.1 Gfo/Idh/MocA family oxidoreductase [Armatimonadota bacterium]
MGESTASVAVIGCGYWGKNLVRNFAEMGVLSAVCDTTEAGRTTARAIAPDAAIYDSTEELLASGVQAVAIATPAETHTATVRAALSAGKDVFVEKPLALSRADGERLVEQAHQAGRILMVGHVLEYHPGIRRLVELAQTGALGRLQYVYSNRLSLGKIRREENILWSFAPHDVAVILRLVGGLPVEVSAAGGSWVTAGIADVTVTNLRFANGVRGHIHVSWLHPFKEQRLVVIGDAAMATFDDVGKKLVVYDQHVSLDEGVPLPHKGEAHEEQYPDKEPLRLECEAFVHAVLTRNPPLTDGVSGVRVLAVLEAAQASLTAMGQPKSVPAYGV